MTENSTSPSDIGSIFEEAAPGFDRQRYDVALGPLDITPAQRVELLSTLWAMLRKGEWGYSGECEICPVLTKEHFDTFCFASCASLVWSDLVPVACEKVSNGSPFKPSWIVSQCKPIKFQFSLPDPTLRIGAIVEALSARTVTCTANLCLPLVVSFADRCHVAKAFRCDQFVTGLRKTYSTRTFGSSKSLYKQGNYWRGSCPAAWCN